MDWDLGSRVWSLGFRINSLGARATRESNTAGILDFKQVWSLIFKLRRISGSADQPFQTRYRFLPDF
jgi:hypothetical protein